MWINNYLQNFTQQYPNTGTTLYSSHGQRWEIRQYSCLLQIYNGTLVSAIDYALFPTRHCSYSDLILNAVSSSGFPRRWLNWLSHLFVPSLQCPRTQPQQLVNIFIKSDEWKISHLSYHDMINMRQALSFNLQQFQNNNTKIFAINQIIAGNSEVYNLLICWTRNMY